MNMSYGCRAGNAIEIIPDDSAPYFLEQAVPPPNDQSIWATEDDYRAWNDDPSLDAILHPAQDIRQPPSQSQSRAGSEQHPNNKQRGSSQGDSAASNSKSRAIGRMFFKTKLCCKFRAGTCPYVTNCNFAHVMEELRKPPPNWQEMVAALEEGSVVPRDEQPIPIGTSSVSVGDEQRSYMGKQCKKIYTEEGCTYGDMRTLMHDDHSKSRESVAINLSSSVGGEAYGGGSVLNQKFSNWKTRICNKWEMSGYCPFGSKCHFAHGAAELHRYGGGLVDMETNDSSSRDPDTKLAFASTKATADAVASSITVPHADVYHIGFPAQRSAIVNQRQVQMSIQKWKGPDKITRIYGDWIDDMD